MKHIWSLQTQETVKRKWGKTYWSINRLKNFVAGPRASNPHSDSAATMIINNLCIQQIFRVTAQSRKDITNPEYFSWGGIYIKSVKKYLNEIISNNNSFYQPKKRNKWSWKQGGINEEVIAVVLAALVGQICWLLSLVSRLVAFFYWYPCAVVPALSVVSDPTLTCCCSNLIPIPYCFLLYDVCYARWIMPR